MTVKMTSKFKMLYLLKRVCIFLTKTSLDERSQIYSVFVGHMGFVGPRSALFNQEDLFELTNRAGMHVLKTGLPDWAQVNDCDELPNPYKVEFDKAH
jgi:O-antigen biosynthesis protein WbqP